MMSDSDIWSAIGDPTRRELLDALLQNGSGTASSLADGMPMTRQAVSKHLTVLEKAELVHSTTAGRERVFQPDYDQLARAAEQLSAVGAAWDRRLHRIARLAEEIEQMKGTHD